MSEPARSDGDANPRLHPFIVAIEPVIEALGAQIVDLAQCEPGDLPLCWDGRTLAAVRQTPLYGALDRLIGQVERELGGPLGELERELKQEAIRRLDKRGAFTVRRAVDLVSDAMGVSRITVYNYLNALHR